MAGFDMSDWTIPLSVHSGRFLSKKSRRMRCAGHVARMEEKRYARKILMGKPEGKRPLGRPRRGW
jgi:hypothetical protein